MSPRGIYVRKTRRHSSLKGKTRQTSNDEGIQTTSATAPTTAPAIKSRVRPRIVSRTAKPAGKTSTVEGELSQKTLRLIDAVRKPYAAIVEDWGIITQSRDQIAPAFIKAYTAYKSESGEGLTSFVRVLYPDLPTDREGYRNHPALNSAQYIMQLARAEPKQQLPPSKRPVTPLVALGRLLATVLPMLDPENGLNGPLWQAFVKEMKWPAAMAKRVQTLAMKEGAIPLNIGRTAGRLRTGTHG